MLYILQQTLDVFEKLERTNDDVNVNMMVMRSKFGNPAKMQLKFVAYFFNL